MEKKIYVVECRYIGPSEEYRESDREWHFFQEHTSRAEQLDCFQAAANYERKCARGKHWEYRILNPQVEGRSPNSA